MALSKSIALGSLKQVAEIQRLVSTSDEFGFQSDEWTKIATVRCKTEFDDRLMREVFKDNGIDGTFVKIFTFRYIPGITEKDRITFKNENYEIYGINNIDDENRFLKVWGRKICL